MRHTILLLMLVLAPGIMAQNGNAPVKEITPQELANMFGQVQVIDVNEAETFAEAHVPGAKLLAYDAITAEVLPVDTAIKLVFYCWSPECPAAGQAAQAAAQLGHPHVYCMPAGITGWQDAGLPTEP